MSFGVVTTGDNANVTIDENSICYEFLGVYTPIANRMVKQQHFVGTSSETVWDWTHYVDIVSPRGRPLVFMDIPYSSSNSVTSQGCAVIGSKYLGSNTYRIYLTTTNGYSASVIRAFGQINTPSSDSYGIRINNSSGNLIFDSGKKMLWVSAIGRINMTPGFTSSSAVNEPSGTVSGVITDGAAGDLGGYSIACQTRAPIWRSDSSQHYYIFYHYVFSYISSTLYGKWVRTYHYGENPKVESGYNAVAPSFESYNRRFALILNSAFS